ncbi:c-type cytochrome [Salipiger mucosus]|uniref:Cytochrome c2 n=1 Tax=Salipiger mucosus DSM 16094 TaxID=1123237 RepID=S9Q481_9RHOB|nr:cytochrome c family protein [Salipiger mucosus]EPX76116.1 Cytochrome c2 [Salipiger mucosus DSM 16094]
MIGRMLAASAVALTLTGGAAIAESHGGMEITGDAEAGERVFRKCRACHMVGEDAQNRVGPVLNGVIGRNVASVEDFAYSDTLATMGEEGKTWTPEEMAAFLEKPRDYAEGTKMAFAGLRKEEDRADVIAYLATFGTEGDGGS